MGSETTFFATIICPHTGLPMVGRFVWNGAAYELIAASKQRPGSVLPEEGRGRVATYQSHASYRCPQCGASSFVQCGRCSQLACWEESWEIFRCPRCGDSGPVHDFIERITGGRG